jgi:hypothetical protein
MLESFLGYTNLGHNFQPLVGTYGSNEANPI